MLTCIYYSGCVSVTRYRDPLRKERTTYFFIFKGYLHGFVLNDFRFLFRINLEYHTVRIQHLYFARKGIQASGDVGHYSIIK